MIFACRQMTAPYLIARQRVEGLANPVADAPRPIRRTVRDPGEGNHGAR